MTHGHLLARNKDGKEINLYTYHDGHTEELLEHLKELPVLLAQRHHMKDMVQHIEDRADWDHAVGRLFHPPDLDYAPVFATAFVQCHPEVNTWMILPSEFKDAMSYPGPDMTVILEIEEGVYNIEWEEDERSCSTTIRWREIFIETSYELGMKEKLNERTSNRRI